MLSAVFQIDFHGRKPETIWHFQKKTAPQRPGTPDPQHRMPIRDDQAAETVIRKRARTAKDREQPAS